jgi:parallel beta-helix repeat protein
VTPRQRRRMVIWLTASAAVGALALTACAGTQAGSAAADPAASRHSAGAPAPAGAPGAPGSAPVAGLAGGATVACPASGGTTVSTASDLRHALAGASPGEVIVLAPGDYRGHFTATRSGTAASPITLCGPRSAMLDGGGIDSGYTLYLNRASWWRVAGFTVQSGQKGVVTDGVSHDLISGLDVHGTGDEGIHLRSFSSDNTVSGNTVSDTGLLTPFYGEGIYVGSAHENWCRYSGCQPDASNDNVIAGNYISDTTAENIDIKEGTAGGKIIGNHFDGTGMAPSAATAWVNVKGNGWLIEDNTGTGSIKDGFQVHQVYPGWGLGNVFHHNTLSVNGPGYGIYVQSHRLRAVVGCDNVVTGAARGFSNIPCTRSR